MLIVSDFRDYYDFVQSMGIDKKCVYNRTTKRVTNHNIELPYVSTISVFCRNDKRTASYLDITKGVIGFCGQIYKILSIGKSICHNVEDVDVYVEEKLNKACQEYYHNNVRFRRRRSWLTQKWIKTWFENQQVKVPPEIWESTPVWYAYRREGMPRTEVFANPQLTLYNFQRIKDPISAFQEIAMFLSSPNEPQIPEIDDKTMAQAKGFDKWSFRKQSTKKK